MGLHTSVHDGVLFGGIGEHCGTSCLKRFLLSSRRFAFIPSLIALGYWLSDVVHMQAVTPAQRDASGTARAPQIETIGLGIVVFAAWLASLAEMLTV